MLQGCRKRGANSRMRCSPMAVGPLRYASSKRAPAKVQQGRKLQKAASLGFLQFLGRPLGAVGWLSLIHI
eukprot:13211914-Alexandrium_andersonii.AAC.1